MGFQFIQVDFDDLVKIILGSGINLRIAGELLGQGFGPFGQIFPACTAQIGGHGGIVTKQGGGRANLSAHIADGGFPGSRQLASPIPKVFQNGIGPAFDGQDAGYFEDNIFGRSPSAQSSGQVNPD